MIEEIRLSDKKMNEIENLTSQEEIAKYLKLNDFECDLALAKNKNIDEATFTALIEKNDYCIYFELVENQNIDLERLKLFANCETTAIIGMAIDKADAKDLIEIVKLSGSLQFREKTMLYFYLSRREERDENFRKELERNSIESIEFVYIKERENGDLK